jgi:hypothetical protein
VGFDTGASSGAVLIYFGESAWHLKSTQHMGPYSDAVHCRIYVRTEDRWAKEIR